MIDFNHLSGSGIVIRGIDVQRVDDTVIGSETIKPVMHHENVAPVM